MEIIPGFQGFLISKGWRRFKREFVNKKLIEVDDCHSNFISTYGPLCYFFDHSNYPGIELFYGLEEYKKPPYMNIGNRVKIYSDQGHTYQDACIEILRSVKYELIYKVILSDQLLFCVSCKSQKAVIEIINKQCPISY